jgi:hypothetical protein
MGLLFRSIYPHAWMIRGLLDSRGGYGLGLRLKPFPTLIALKIVISKIPFLVNIRASAHWTLSISYIPHAYPPTVSSTSNLGIKVRNNASTYDVFLMIKIKPRHSVENPLQSSLFTALWTRVGR